MIRSRVIKLLSRSFTTKSRLHQVPTSQGVSLGVHVVESEQSDRSVSRIPILFVPGIFSDHSFWLGPKQNGLAHFMAADNQYVSYVFDPRGHGHSAKPQSGDRWHCASWATDDIPAVLDFISEREESHEPLIIAHSMGTAMTLASMAAQPRPVRALVLMCCPRAGQFPLFQRLLLHIAIPTLPIIGRFPARLLRMGHIDDDAHICRTWFQWNLSGRYTLPDGSCEDLHARFGGIRSKRLPLLFLAASGDGIWAPPHLCRKLYDEVADGDDSLVAEVTTEQEALDLAERFGQSTFVTIGNERDNVPGKLPRFDHPGIVVHREARRVVWPLIKAFAAKV